MVDHVYCINLERRPDRRASAEHEFYQNGIGPVEFFNGTDGKLDAPDDIYISKPEWGCSDSHIRIWRDMVSKGYETALVFEDDVVILPDFKNKLILVLEDLKNLPEWDYVNLGPLEFKNSHGRASQTLVKGAAYGGHCYLISLKCANHVSKWETSDLHYCQDVQLAKSPLKMYYTSKPLANQESFNSSIFGVITSWVKGDIGFKRTPDWDFLIRYFFQNKLFISILILLLIKLSI